MTKIIELKIRSERDAVRYINFALAGRYDDKELSITFDGWPNFDLNIKGKRYSSTLPTGVMKALIEYQNSLNRVFASVAYDRSAKALTDDDRNDVELVFEVKEGSSEAQANVWDAATRLGERAIERMNGKQLVITVLGSALLLSSAYVGMHWMDTQAAIEQDKSKNELVEKILENNAHLAQLNADMAKTAMAVVKGAHDADSIKYGKTRLNKERIEDLNYKGRAPTISNRIDGDYQVIQLKRFSDRFKIVLESKNGQIVQTTLYRGQNAAKCIEEISAAFAKNTKISMYILGKFKEKELVSATILGTKFSGLMAPESLTDNQ